MNILAKLFAAAVSLGSNVREKRAIAQTLKARPEVLRKSAADIAAARKRKLHAEGCMQGYQRKIRLARSGVGNHTISGIPSWMHDRSN